MIALVCVICLEIAEDPWQHGKCGRLLCKECLEKLGRNKPCPNCRMEQPQYFEDNKSKCTYLVVIIITFTSLVPPGKREIKALLVKCANVGRGCEWEGTVGTLEQHVATCEFALVPCPKGCKDENNGVQHFTRKGSGQPPGEHLPQQRLPVSALRRERHVCQHNTGSR